ncbi:MAG: signal transduction histidine kinase [Parvicella sp.]|jgi:signal transduction histidine kinase
MELGTNLQTLAMNKYKLVVIVIISILASLLAAGILLVFLNEPLTKFVIISGILFTILSLSFLAYDLIITKRLKQSFGRFITQIKKGNFESKKSNIIQKYDFVNLTDIQVELSQMVGQIQADSKEQKRYIENVSHELMSPISIIRGKLELLIQSPNIEKNDFRLINSILLKLDRLTKVNQSLVLLSKLDYNHYTEKTEVNLSEIIDETLNLFEDQIRVDELTIRKEVKENVIIKMSEPLAYLLIKNIIKNAVIHNIEKGFIQITEFNGGISIANSGNILEKSTDQLFERFEVGSDSPDSIGLGLSIIQKICDTNSIELSYQHDNGKHTVSLSI